MEQPAQLAQPALQYWFRFAQIHHHAYLAGRIETVDIETAAIHDANAAR